MPRSSQHAASEENAARWAMRDEVLFRRAKESGGPTGITDVRSVLKCEENALVYRCLMHYHAMIEVVEEGDAIFKRALASALSGVREAPKRVWNKDSALEVKGIGPKIARILERSLFTLYEQDAHPGARDEEGEVPEEEEFHVSQTAAAGGGGGRTKRKATASGGPSSQKKAPYRPKNGTANYAFLVWYAKKRTLSLDPCPPPSPSIPHAPGGR